MQYLLKNDTLHVLSLRLHAIRAIRILLFFLSLQVTMTENAASY